MKVINCLGVWLCHKPLIVSDAAGIIFLALQDPENQKCVSFILGKCMTILFWHLLWYFHCAHFKSVPWALKLEQFGKWWRRCEWTHSKRLLMLMGTLIVTVVFLCCFSRLDMNICEENKVGWHRKCAMLWGKVWFAQKLDFWHLSIQNWKWLS